MRHLPSMRPTVVKFAVLVFILTAPLSANFWDGEGGDDRWDNPANWSQGVVPLGAWQNPAGGWDDPSCPCYPLTPDPSDDGPQWNNDALLRADNATIVIDETTTTPPYDIPGGGMNPGPGPGAFAYGVRIGFEGASNTLEMRGGRLEIGGIPPGQTDREGWHLDVGRGFNRTANPNPFARFEMTGGIVDTNLIKVPEGFVDESLSDPYDTPGLNGEFLVSGGTIIGRKLNLGQFTGNGYAELSGDAKLILWPSVASNSNNAGHFEMKQDWFIQGLPAATVADAYLDIRDDAVMYIFGNIDQFKMTPDQAELDRYGQYVEDGWLTANNGTAAPKITLQTCPDDGSLDEYCLSGLMITIAAPLTGDLDDDGLVGASDLSLVLANWGQLGDPPPMGWVNDLPDGIIGANSLSLVLSNWGEVAAAVPEPTAAWTLTIGVLVWWKLYRDGANESRQGAMR